MFKCKNCICDLVYDLNYVAKTNVEYENMYSASYSSLLRACASSMMDFCWGIDNQYSQ